VATIAFHLLVTAFERELGFFIVVEFCPPPCGLIVALVALFSQLTGVPVVLAMAGIAIVPGLTMFFVGQMAALALGCFVRPLEDEICHSMIEGLVIKMNHIGTSSNVIGVAVFALQSIQPLTVTVEAVVL